MKSCKINSYSIDVNVANETYNEDLHRKKITIKQFNFNHNWKNYMIIYNRSYYKKYKKKCNKTLKNIVQNLKRVSSIFI